MGPTPMVGRADQQRAVLEAVEEGAALVVVSGEAGIGKSRLVAECTEDLRDQGAVVVTGHCVSLAGRLPLLPFVEAFEGLGARVRPMVESVPDGLRPALAGVVPSAGVVGDGRENDPRGSWEQQRLFLAVRAFLRAWGGAGPLVLVLEDLHWADGLSLDLLAYLVTTGGTGTTIVATLRADERPMSERVLATLAEMQRLVECVDVRLGPLSVDEVADLGSNVVGRRLSDAMGQRLARLGGGNPFFTEQLSRQPDLLAVGPADPASLPPRLNDVLGARLRTLSPSALRALLVVGVAEVPLNPAQLTEAAQLSADELVGAVGELSDGAFLAPVEGGRLVTRHALLATAVAGMHDPVSLADAHARVAAVLDAVGDPSLAVACAGHWRAAGQDAEELEALLVAAPVAEGLADFDTAATLWSRAWDLVSRPGGPPDGFDANWIEVALSAIDTLDAAGRMAEAEAIAEAAYARLAPDDRSEPAGRLLGDLGHRRSVHDLASGRELLREAVEVLSQYPPSSDLVWYLARLGGIERMAGRHAEGRSWLERAVALSEEHGSPWVVARAANGLSDALLHDGLPDEAEAVLERCAARPDVAGSGHAQGVLASYRSQIVLDRGDLAEAATMTQTGLDQMDAEGYGSTWDAYLLGIVGAMANLELGRVEQAVRLTDPVLGSEPRSNTVAHHALRAVADLCRGHVEVGIGRCESAYEVACAEASLGLRVITAESLAHLHLWARQPQRVQALALDTAAAVRGTDWDAGIGELLALGARAVADLSGSARARRAGPALAAAQTMRDELQAAKDSCASDPFTPVVHGGPEGGFGLQWRAELARAKGDEDADLWSAAAEEWHRPGRVHREAYCRWRRAEAVLAGGGSAPDVAEDLRAAFELSEQMAPQRRAVEALAARLHLRLTTAPAEVPDPAKLPVELTPREREILGHLVAGRSNREIGKDLFISDKTVSVHVSNLLRKIGVADRVQAAAWAEQVGIADRGG